MANPHKYDSIQDYLAANDFILNEDFFVKGEIKIPVAELIGHTVGTFAEKARERGWVGLEADSVPPSAGIQIYTGIKSENPHPLDKLLRYWGIAIPPGATVTKLYKDGQEICGWMSDGSRLLPLYVGKDPHPQKIRYKGERGRMNRGADHDG